MGRRKAAAGTAETKPDIALELSVAAGDWPGRRTLRGLVGKAVDAALAEVGVRAGTSELSVLFTDDAAIRSLNAGWRRKDKATNVLSFPAFPVAPGDALPPMLGDIVLAAETVRREAEQDGKPLNDHIAHLVIHGLLHLLGHDHEDDAEADRMEALERAALARLAIPDPYA